MKLNWEKIAKDVVHFVLVCAAGGLLGSTVLKDVHPGDWYI